MALKVQPKPNTGLFEIKSESGPIPKDLEGAYTSKWDADNAIKAFREINIKPTVKAEMERKEKRDAASRKYKTSK